MSEPIDLSEVRHDWLKILLRHAAPILTPTEFRIVMFVYERTLLWDKDHDFISISQISGGVYADRKLVTGGTGLSDATIYRTIDTLEKKGLLLREKNGPGKQARFTFNFSWNLIDYISLTLAENPQFKHDFSEGMQLFVGPGDGKLLSSMRESTLTHETTSSHPREIQKEIIQKEINTGRAGTPAREPLETVTKEDTMPTSAVDALRSKMQQTVAKTDASINKNKKKLNATALQDIWRQEFQKTYPTERFFKWTVADMSMFKNKVHENVPLSQAEEFVQFCVKHFANVIADRLKWMKGPPRLPDVRFVTKQIATYWLAFDDMNDPNRVIRHRVEQAAAQPPKLKVKPKPTVSATKLAELENENAAMRDKLRDIGKAEIAQRSNRTKEARKLVTNRKTSDPEFGEWDG